MKPKKNPKVDLRKNSTTYFLIGLVLVFFITRRAIELKTYDKEIDLNRLTVVNDDEEDIPITEMNITSPPPPPSTPQLIEVVEDEDVEETIIESTETDPEEIIEVEEVIVAEEDEDLEVPFAII